MPIDWKYLKLRPQVHEKAVKSIKSSSTSWIEEFWGGDSGGVEITRWYLSSPEDAVIFPSTGLATSPNDPFRGWDKSADIGDKTYWNGPDYVIFTKGSLVAKVFLNSRFLNNEQQKAYTKRIAQYIADKL